MAAANAPTALAGKCRNTTMGRIADDVAAVGPFQHLDIVRGVAQRNNDKQAVPFPKMFRVQIPTFGLTADKGSNNIQQNS